MASIIRGTCKLFRKSLNKYDLYSHEKRKVSRDAIENYDFLNISLKTLYDAYCIEAKSRLVDVKKGADCTYSPPKCGRRIKT